MNKERIITILILTGLFGGLVGGPIASLLDYHAPPVKRFKLFIIPEFIGFTCRRNDIFWKSDVLRGSSDLANYRQPVMTLLF